jgi:hypothetical protein
VGGVSRRSRRTPGELRRGYRHPVRRDRAFWAAVGISAAVIVVEFALASPSTPLGWVAFGILAAALAAMIITLAGVFVGTVRGFSDGWRAGGRSRLDRARATSTSRGTPTGGADTGEATTMTTPTGDEPKADPRPTDDDDDDDDDDDGLPRPTVPDSVKQLAAAAQAKAPKKADVDRTARALGRAAGAARRAYRKDD